MADNSETETMVKGLVDRLVDGWNAHDAEAFAQPFAENADFTNVFGMRAHGRAEITRFHAPIFATMFKDSRLAATDTKVRFLRPDVAAVDVRWEMAGACDPQGNEWPLRIGLMSLVATSVDGNWSISVMHNMDLPSEDLARAQAKIQGGAA